VPCPVRHMEAPDEVSRKSSPPCGGLLDSQRARLRACSRSCRKARGRGAVQGRRRRRAERACPGRRRGASYLSVARPRSSTLRTRRAPEWQRRFWIEPPAQCGHTRYNDYGELASYEAFAGGNAVFSAMASQTSLSVQASPSSHGVPLAIGGLLHAPVAGSQVPASWHWS